MHRRSPMIRWTLAAATVVAALMSLPTSALAGGWLGIPSTGPISSPAESTSGATAAVGANGAEVAAWTSGSAVLVSVRSPGGGAFSAPVTVNATSGSNTVKGSPSVAIDAAGDALIVWVQFNGTSYSIQEAIARPGAAVTFGAGLPSSGSSVPISSPHAVFLSDGTAVVAWVPTGEPIQYSRGLANGEFGGPVSFVPSGSVSSFSIAPTSTDGVLLGWDEATSSLSGKDTTTVSYLKVGDLAPSSGAVSGVQALDKAEYTCEEGAIFCDEIGFAGLGVSENSAGDGLISYQQVKSSFIFQSNEVRAAYQPEGRSFESTPSTLATNGGLGGANAEGTVLADGTALVAWDEPYPSSPSAISYAEKAPSSAFPAQGQTLVSSTKDKYALPSLAPVGDGASLVYVDENEQGDGVLAQTFTSGGPTGIPSVLSRGEGSLNSAYVASDGAGDAIAMWERFGKSTEGVETASYDAGPRLSGLSAPAAGQVGAPLGFAVSASDPLSPLASVGWTFSDGASASGTNVTHSYTTAGSQTASVIATDAAGLTSLPLSATMFVSFPPASIHKSLPPTAVRFAPTVTIPSQRLAAVLRNGLALTVGCRSACTITLKLEISHGLAKSLHLLAHASKSPKAKSGPVIVGSATVKFTKAGSRKVHVKLTKQALKRLRHTHKLTLSVLVSGKSAGSTSTLTKQVSLH